MVKVILSFDDGSPEDEKLVNILNRYDFGCTLFVPKNNIEGRLTMDARQLLDLSKFAEIGSHTLNHVYLNKLTLAEALDEVLAGHSYIEDITGCQSDKFCYPGGKFNRRIDNKVKSYIKYRRTTENFRSEIANRDLIPTFIQFYPHNRFTYTKNIFKYFSTSKIKYLNTNNFLDCILAKVCSSTSNEVIHVWGHSWELEEFNLWPQFEYLLDYCKDMGVFVGSIGEVYQCSQ